MSGSVAGRPTALERAAAAGASWPRAAREPVRGIRNRSPLQLARMRFAAALRSAGRGRVLGGVRHFSAFVGYARSGSTLVGALLDAHPQAVFAHELDALGFVSKGFGRRAMFQLLIENARDFALSGGEWTGYSYRVPDQWQGRFSELRVLGDKKAGISAARLCQKPSLLDDLRDTVRVPLKLIHVIRNPFDNLTTKILSRPAFGRALHTQRYFYLCASVQALKERGDAPEMLDVRIENLIREPRAQLGRLLDFLGLDPVEDYLDAASSIVYESPRRSRHRIDWTPEHRADVEARMRDFPFLAGYTYED